MHTLLFASYRQQFTIWCTTQVAVEKELTNIMKLEAIISMHTLLFGLSLCGHLVVGALGRFKQKTHSSQILLIGNPTQTLHC